MRSPLDTVKELVRHPDWSWREGMKYFYESPSGSGRYMMGRWREGDVFPYLERQHDLMLSLDDKTGGLLMGVVLELAKELMPLVPFGGLSCTGPESWEAWVGDSMGLGTTWQQALAELWLALKRDEAG